MAEVPQRGPRATLGPKPGVMVHGLAQPGAPSPALMTQHPSPLW